MFQGDEDVFIILSTDGTPTQSLGSADGDIAYDGTASLLRLAG